MTHNQTIHLLDRHAISIQNNENYCNSNRPQSTYPDHFVHLFLCHFANPLLVYNGIERDKKRTSNQGV